MPNRDVIFSLTERLPKFSLRCDALPLFSLTERLPKFTMRCDALPLFSLTERLPKFIMREDNSVSNDVYVRVSPSEVQWITDDVGVVFNVKSNTDWEII